MGQALQSEQRETLLAGRHHAETRRPEEGGNITRVAVDKDAPRQTGGVDACLERRLQRADAVVVQLRIRDLSEDALEHLKKQLMLLLRCVARQIDHPFLRQRSRFDGLGHTRQRVRDHTQLCGRHTGLEQVPPLLFRGNNEAVERVRIFEQMPIADFQLPIGKPMGAVHEGTDSAVKPAACRALPELAVHLVLVDEKVPGDVFFQIGAHHRADKVTLGRVGDRGALRTAQLDGLQIRAASARLERLSYQDLAVRQLEFFATGLRRIPRCGVADLSQRKPGSVRLASPRRRASRRTR
ncbi:hypothetical protein D9M72_421820 [compost metagenome]